MKCSLCGKSTKKKTSLANASVNCEALNVLSSNKTYLAKSTRPNEANPLSHVLGLESFNKGSLAMQEWVYKVNYSMLYS